MSSPARWPWATVGLVVAAAAIAGLPGFGAALAWQPDAGWWRLLSCQLTHWDADHLHWDVLAVAILGCWSETRWPAATRSTLAIGTLAIPLVVVIAHPGLAYRGLSGLACALAAVGSVRALREARRCGDGPALVVAAGLLAGLLAKTAWELSTGDAVFAAATGWTPLPLAHIAGILVGSTIGLLPHGVRTAAAPSAVPGSITAAWRSRAQP